MEKINLKREFEAKAFYNKCLYDLDNNQIQCVFDLMKEVAKQILQLAAENAEICECDPIFGEIEYSINKQSILDVINLIE